MRNIYWSRASRGFLYKNLEAASGFLTFIKNVEFLSNLSTLSISVKNDYRGIFSPSLISYKKYYFQTMKKAASWKSDRRTTTRKRLNYSRWCSSSFKCPREPWARAGTISIAYQNYWAFFFSAFMSAYMKRDQLPYELLNDEWTYVFIIIIISETVFNK